LLLLCLLPARPAAAGRLSAGLEELLAGSAADSRIGVIVRFADPGGGMAKELAALEWLPRREKRGRLAKRAAERVELSTLRLRPILERHRATGRIEDVKPLRLANALAIKGSPEAIRELAADATVQSVSEDRVVRLVASRPSPASSPGWNLTRIGAPQLWARGLVGQGVVVANLDTGVDGTHPALQAKWRGGSNSWFDPHRGTPLPYDPDGHGTAVMGVMVAGDVNLNPVGVAPGALWIAAKIFDDSGFATMSSIHRAFDWVLDPDGDPASDDAADVVNNSWDLENPGGVDLEFAADIDALRSAAIGVVFAAGNGLNGQGLPVPPATNTSMSPANNPGALSVGATDINDQVADFSSRGPSALDGSIYPILTAPGVHVTSTLPHGAYATYTNLGTSFAAPHVSGAMALLMGGGTKSLAAIEAALKSSAADIDLPGADNSSGYGRLDVAAAAQALGSTPPLLPGGDVDGSGAVDLGDLLLLLRVAAGRQPATPAILASGDMAPLGPAGLPSPDGKITAADVLIMLRRYLGIISW